MIFWDLFGHGGHDTRCESNKFFVCMETVTLQPRSVSWRCILLATIRSGWVGEPGWRLLNIVDCFRFRFDWPCKRFDLVLSGVLRYLVLCTVHVKN